MSKTRHTPGPWKTSAVGKNWYIEQSGGYVIADINQAKAYKHAHHANARLLAASPDLLSALQSLVDDIDARPECATMNLPLAAARDAIRKAKGE